MPSEPEPEPAESASVAVPESGRERAARREARAVAAIQAITSGGDLSAETLALSNEFTDETSARIKNRLGLGRRRS